MLYNKKYANGGDVDLNDEEKSNDLARNWAMARARLGIQSQAELDELKSKRQSWKNWIADMQLQSQDDFKQRNLEQSIWGKIGSGVGLLAGSYLGGKDYVSDKWDPLISGVTTGLGSATARYGASQNPFGLGTEIEDYTYEDFITANPEYAGDLGGKFHLSEKADLASLTEEDISSLDAAITRAKDDELLEGALSSLTDAYTGKEVSTEDWIKNLFA